MAQKSLTQPKTNLLKYLLVVTFLYALLGLLGVTTSHTGALFGNSEERSATIYGEERHQRSDEFLRGSPRVIAYLRGTELKAYTPLDYTGSDSYQVQQKSLIARTNLYLTPVHEIFINKLAKSLPTAMGFAFLWWINVWVLFVFVPVWFFFLGLRSYWGVLCALALFFSPPNNWFSYLPTFLIAQAVMSCCLLIFAITLLGRNKWWNHVTALILGAYAGRLAFTVIQYPPWGIPVLLVTGIVTVLFLFKGRPDRSLIRNFLMVLFAGTIAAVIVYIFNKSLYSTALDTVYPGQRREAGGNGDQGLWSGGIAWFFQSNFARHANLANPEVIMGPTFVLIPTLFFYFSRDILSGLTDWLRRAVNGGLSVCLALLCWSQFHWPNWALKFNPLVFIPSGRADQILGVVILIPLFLLIASTEGTRVKSGIALLVTALTVGVASRDMQSTQQLFLVGSDASVLMLSVLAVAVVTFSILKFQHPIFRITPLIVLMIASSVGVNPIVKGLGALGDSQAVSVVMDLGKSSPDGRWATNGYFQDALMISTGVPQLSGQQAFGPNKDVWRKIDTKNEFENNWNRGQSYIQFVWDSREKMTIWNPSPDVIQIVIRPCDSRLQDVQLRWVTSSTALDYECLRKRGQVEWIGQPLYIYEILNSKMFDDRGFDFSR